MQKNQSKSLSEALAQRGISKPAVTTELVAVIRDDSKYQYQKAMHKEPFSVRVEPDKDGYVLIGGVGGRYRLQDVHLYANTPQGLVGLSAEANCHDG